MNICKKWRESVSHLSWSTSITKKPKKNEYNLSQYINSKKTRRKIRLKKAMQENNSIKNKKSSK